MNFTIIIRVMIEISATSPKEISKNDIKEDAHGLEISANISETTNDVCTEIKKNTLNPKLNHNYTTTDDCVNSIDHKIEDTDLNQKDDKEVSNLVIPENEENEECSNKNFEDELENEGKVFELKDTSNVDQECKLHLDDDVDITKYVLITPTGNAKNLNQSSDCVETIKKVGFSTDEILDFIKTKREKIINSDECRPSDKEICEYFSFLAKHCAVYSKGKTSEDLQILLLEDYIKARKERMLFYNTYEIFENGIEFIIETSEKLPCSDNVAREIKVAKNIFRFIKEKTSSRVSKKSYIVSDLDLGLYVQFVRSIECRFCGGICICETLYEDFLVLKEIIKYELNDFNTYIPSDREIESFISTSVKSMDNSGNKIQIANKECNANERRKYFDLISKSWNNLRRL